MFAFADITEFIKEESGHPGGSEIPLEYAGKDATEFWTDMHGHLEDEIMEAIDSNDLEDTTMADLGLDALPVVVGIADGEAPASARGPGFPTTNWAGNILWSAHTPPRTHRSVGSSHRATPLLLQVSGGRGAAVPAVHDADPPRRLQVPGAHGCQARPSRHHENATLLCSVLCQPS